MLLSCSFPSRRCFNFCGLHDLLPPPFAFTRNCGDGKSNFPRDGCFGMFMIIINIITRGKAWMIICCNCYQLALHECVATAAICNNFFLSNWYLLCLRRLFNFMSDQIRRVQNDKEKENFVIKKFCRWKIVIVIDVTSLGFGLIVFIQFVINNYRKGKNFWNVMLKGFLSKKL